MIASGERLTATGNTKMKRRYAKMMHEMNSDVSYRKSYSGRGMYGDDTAAVTGDYHDLMTAARDALIELVKDVIYDDGDVEKVEKVIHDFHKEVHLGRRDSMGLGEVWY